MCLKKLPYMECLNKQIPSSLAEDEKVSFFDLNPQFSKQKVLQMLQNEHQQSQQQFSKQITSVFQLLEQLATSNDYVKLKNDYVNLISTNYGVSNKLIYLLIDMQNDFVIRGGALYISQGESAIIHNMAYLDALNELINQYPEFKSCVEMVTTQDAHLIGRTKRHPDYHTLQATDAKRTLTAKLCFEIEQDEILSPFRPKSGGFGPHCIIGTIGVDFPLPIRRRLEQLDIPIFSFAKINFSAVDAAMKIQTDVNLCLQKDSLLPTITDVSFCEFFKEKVESTIHIGGVCADVCVQLSALGIAEVFHCKHEKIYIIDELTQYLDLSRKPSVEQLRLKKNIQTIHLNPTFSWDIGL
jgi:nicotinamidase-related amidase